MNKNIIITVTIVVLALVVGYALLQKDAGSIPEDASNVVEEISTSDAEARKVVTEFGESLKNVSLIGPTAVEDMAEQYSNFVTPELLDSWAENPENAPGRLTSSPWPERIEIEDSRRASETEYRMLGHIIEVTSTDTEEDAVIKRPIEVIVNKVDDIWLISELIRKTEE